MSTKSDKRSEEFLQVSGQFKLGALITESSHPVTAGLGEVARQDIGQALDLLFQVDNDVLEKYREFSESRKPAEIKERVLAALKIGGRIFFTGCGSTGRLSIQLVSLWRKFWQQDRSGGRVGASAAEAWADRVISVMAGGDFALIKSVEGFEDFAAFGEKQIGDLGVSSKDVVFAITEGGETSFVIGTAWKAVEAGAKVYFVYNNPDDVLCRNVQRSREVIQDARIEKINLATGPMAVAGSTRMQATTIQLCVLVTILEMVLRDLAGEPGPDAGAGHKASTVPEFFAQGLAGLLRGLRNPEFLARLASLVALEHTVYRNGHKTNYYADTYALDVLTDTTERSPTYCTPPFRKFDDSRAAESWAFLFTPGETTAIAWERLLQRAPRCVEWSADEARSLAGPDQLQRTLELLRRISPAELMRFRIGRDGLAQRPPRAGDAAIAILSGGEANLVAEPGGFVAEQLLAARTAGANSGVIWIGAASASGIEFAAKNPGCFLMSVPVPADDSWLHGLQHVALKLVLNALSTCTMARLGRIMDNTMIWVVPSNLKLIDRATRHIQRLTRLDYGRANRLLYEVIEYVEPRMKSDQTYPPVVGLAVMRARCERGNEEAEKLWMAETLA